MKLKTLLKNKTLILSVLLSITAYHSLACKNMCVIGAGYVGLIAGSKFAQMGNNVICTDISQSKINDLNNGIKPIFEPGLQAIVKEGMHQEKLFFTTDVEHAIQTADIIIVAVGTPMGKDGSSNISALINVIETIAKNMQGYTVICIKSTVPIGTNKNVLLQLDEHCAPGALYDLVFNPEFLREGSALKDFSINPIVLGSNSQKALDIMTELYSPLIERGCPLVHTDLTTAEAFKYTWNSFRMTRIMFVNELACLCNTVGADIETLVTSMSMSEQSMPTKNLKPGPGIGGSCFPKDSRALAHTARKVGERFCILEAVIKADQLHKQKMITTIYDLMDNNVRGKKVAIWGLSFKANTDDIRDSVAIKIIKKLLGNGAIIQAYDPQAMKNMHALIPDICYCTCAEKALEDADILVIVTEWQEFTHVDLKTIKSKMRQPIIMDTRNLLNPLQVKNSGFTYVDLGRKHY